ncbi:MAG TPA: glycosyl hydrolase family 18 protein [Pseudobacteroides sp.]|uniref:glycosyl hydrolase family 18 protein n=1 Tax=Pseudobacteroides sp. TaxID=1968840 RepID=UPI002F95C5A6
MRNKRIWLFTLIVISILSINIVNVFASSETLSAPTLSFSPMAPTNGNVTVTIYYPKTAVLKQYRLGTGGIWTTYSAPVVLTSNAYVYARYQNKSGAWSPLGGYPIKNIDKTPPENPTFAASSNTPTNQNVSISINFSTDSVSKQYKLDGSTEWVSYTEPVILTANSIIYAKASDSVGNWSSVESYSVSNIDKTPPSLPIITANIVRPTNAGVDITIDYSHDSYIKQYRVGDEGVWTDYNGSILIGSNTTVYAKASDNAGNWTEEVSFVISNIDTNPPEKPAIAASTTALTDNPVVVSIDFSSDSTIRQHKIGDMGVWMDYTAPFSVNTNKTVYARAADQVGNWSLEASFGVMNIRKTVMGYTVKNYSTDVSSYNSLSANAAVINEIATATFSIDGIGNLIGAAPMDQMNYANNNGIRTKLMVSNNFDVNIARQLLDSPVNRQTLKNNILNLLKLYNYTGVDIDIENIPAACRNNFTAFMSEIYSTLKPLGYGVSVAVQPKTYDSPNATWNYAFDYKALAQYADFLMIMAYDEHYAGGTPGAVASINWVTNVIDYALSIVPKEKIILGLAAYGYDWGGTATKSYSINGCYNIANQYGAVIKFDNTTKSKYFTYTANGEARTVWFEDGETIAYKLDLAIARDIKGIGIWRLGLENSNYWTTIKSKLNK